MHTSGKTALKQRIIPAQKHVELDGPKPRVNEFKFAVQIGRAHV